MLRALRPLSVYPQPPEEVALAPISQMRKLRCGEAGQLPCVCWQQGWELHFLVHFSGGNIVPISQMWTGKVKYHEEVVGILVQFQLSLSP